MVFFKMRDRACDIPMSLPFPGRFLPRLGPPAKAARSFLLQTYLDCGCVERQDQAHQLSVPDADPFSPYSQEGRHDHRTEKETDQSE